MTICRDATLLRFVLCMILTTTKGHQTSLLGDSVEEEQIPQSSMVVHSRHKRSVPSTIAFTFAKEGALSGITAINIGHKMDFKATIFFPVISTRMRIELFTPKKESSALFVLCQPKFTAIGTNFADLNISILNEGWIMESIGGNNQYDRAIIDMGEVKNHGTDVADDSKSKIVFTFSALVLNSPELQTGVNYWVSAGAEFDNNTKVWIGQAIYTWSNDSVTPWGDDDFKISGPSTVAQYSTYVWKLEVTLRKLIINALVVEFYAPINKTALTLGKLSISETTGAATKCLPIFGKQFSTIPVSDSAFQQKMVYTSMSLNIGEVINCQRRIGIPTPVEDTLIIEASAVTTSDAEIGETYKLGGGVIIDGTKVFVDSINVTVEPMAVTTPMSTPTIIMYSPSTQSIVGGVVPILLNISTQADSSVAMNMTLSLPYYSDRAAMSFERVRLIHIGWNYPCLFPTNASVVKTSTNVEFPNETDVMFYDLGIVSHTKQYSAFYSNYFVVELSARILHHDVYNTNTTVTPLVGVRFGNLMWVDSINFEVVENVTEESAVTGVDVTITDMSNRTLHPGSQNLYYLDIYQYPWTQSKAVTIDLISIMDNNFAVVSVCSFKVLHIGEYIFGNMASAYPVIMKSTADDGIIDHIVADTGTWSNIGRFNFTWEASSSLVRFEVIVVINPHNLTTSNILIDNQFYWIATTIMVDRTKVFYEIRNISYDPTDVATSADNTPSFSMTTEESDTILVGDAYSYDFKVVMKPQTITKLLLNTVAVNSSVRVCRLAERVRGKNMPCLGTFSEPHMEPTVGVTGSIQVDLLNYAAFGKIGDPDVDQTMVFDVVAQPLPSSLDSTVHTLGTAAYSSNTNIWVSSMNYTVSTSSAPLSVPENVSMFLRNNSDVHWNSVPATMFIELYIPPGFVDIMAVKVRFSTEVALCQSHVLSAGWNLPCASDMYVNKTYQQSPSYTELDLFYVPNLEKTGNHIDDKNKMVLQVVFIPPADQSSIQINGEIRQSSGVTWSDHLVVMLQSGLPGMVVPKFSVVSPEVTNMHIFQEADWFLNISSTEGFTTLNVTIDSEVSADFESSFSITEVELSYWGDNFCCKNHVKWNPVFTSSSNSTQISKAFIDFGILSNTRTFRRYQWRRGNTYDDYITIKVKARLTDSVGNSDGANRSIRFECLYGTSQKLLESYVAVVNPAIDEPNLVYSILANVSNAVSDDVAIHGSTVLLSAEIKHTEQSRANAYGVAFTFYIPEYITFLRITNWTVLYPNIVFNGGGNGMVLKMNIMRYTDSFSFEMEFTMDPNGIVASRGFTGTQVVTIPADIIYHASNKTGNERPKLDKQYYPTMLFVEIKYMVRRCGSALGMEDHTIKNCQITASSHLGNRTAENGRVNGSGCWSSAPRGPPFVNNEYIQVNFGNITRIEGLLLQPSSYNTSQRVLTFAIHYSYRGLIWLHRTTPGSNTTQSFTANYNATDVAYVDIKDNPIIAQFVRIVPIVSTPNSKIHSLRIELYGCFELHESSLLPPCSLVSQFSGFYDRGYIVDINSSSLYACMVVDIEKTMRCLVTRDFGISWAAMDENIANIIMIDNNMGALYAIAQDKNGRLISFNGGVSWSAISDNEFDTLYATPVSGIVKYTTLPFEDWGTTTADDMFSFYGIQYNASHKFSVQYDGVYATTGGAFTKIANWGDTSWI